MARKQLEKRDPYLLNEYDCGCRIYSEFPAGLGIKHIKYCPLHKAAPDMLAALKRARDYLRYGCADIERQIDAAINKAQGKED